MELFQIDQLDVLLPEAGSDGEDYRFVGFKVVDATLDSGAVHRTTRLQGIDLKVSHVIYERLL